MQSSTLKALERAGLCFRDVLSRRVVITPAGLALADELFGMEWWSTLMKAFVNHEQMKERDRVIRAMLDMAQDEINLGETTFSLDFRPGYNPALKGLNILEWIEAESEFGGIVVRMEDRYGDRSFRVVIVRSFPAISAHEAEQFAADLIEAARICRLMNEWADKKDTANA